MGCCGESSDVEPTKINGHALAPKGGGEEYMGPTNERSCRDIFFLILFIAFCITGIIYLIIAASLGDIDRVIHGYDHYGNVCGKKNVQYLNSSYSGKDETNYPFVTVNVLTSYKTCVQQCSSSSVLIGYTCLDSGIPGTSNATSSYLSNVYSYFKNLANVLNHLAGHMAAVVIIGFVLSFIAALLLRFLAGIIVWIAVGIIAVGCIGATIFIWVYWSQQKSVVDSNRANGLLVAAIIVTVVAGLILLILFAMRSRIRLVITLFTEAGKAIAAMPQLLLQPVWTVLFLSLVVAVWAGGFVVIQASGSPYLTGSDNGISFKMNQIIEGMQWYHIFGFFWVTQFVLACQDVVIAGTVATWYFARDKSHLGSPVISSTSRLIRYHMGSVALGSLIIAIVKMIRFMLKYAEKYANGNNYLKWCLRCCQCLLACFENFLKFLTRNAYIEIAIYGYGFCKSAKKAFGIIANNALRVAAINYVGDFVLFLVQIAVVVANGAIGWFILKAGYGGPDINEIILPLIITIIITYLIVYCFVSVYEMTIDTLFICFCEDCEKNDGLERPYYMSKGLMQFVENSNKALEALENRQKVGKNGVQPIQTVMPQYQYPNSIPPSSYPSPIKSAGNGSMMRTGMTPLHPGYPPVSVPPSPSHFLSRPE